jgi:RNA polymerase sigma factor (sigma-70 family)
MCSPSPYVAPEGDAQDVSRLEDEQLVVLAMRADHRPAWHELIRRSLPLKERLIRRHAARSGLQEADLQDVQQDAVLWIVEAIRSYRAEEHARPEGCHFRSFLHRVLSARFIDFLRHWRRLRRHFPLVGARPEGPTDGETEGPVQGVEEDELRARLLEELVRLDGPTRRLWDLLAGGVSLREAARVLDLSYDATKRRRRLLFAKLRASLGKELGAFAMAQETPRPAPW